MAAHRFGVGANMSLRRRVFDTLGGFDELLGPGTRFRSGEDIDFGYRALRAGFTILQDPENVALHHGGRSLADGEARLLFESYHFGIGAAYARSVRRGDLIALRQLLGEIGLLAGEVAGNVLNRRQPIGYHRLTHLLLGGIAGMREAIEPGGRS
jgi:hypothetical protein